MLVSGACVNLRLFSRRLFFSERKSFPPDSWGQRVSVNTIASLKTRILELAHRPLTDTHVFGTDHCIDSIRQSLMCSADISPITWHWREDGFKQDMNNTHICRDFDAIMRWAEEHMVTREINSRIPDEEVWDVIKEEAEREL